MPMSFFIGLQDGFMAKHFINVSILGVPSMKFLHSRQYYTSYDAYVFLCWIMSYLYLIPTQLWYQAFFLFILMWNWEEVIGWKFVIHTAMVSYFNNKSIIVCVYSIRLSPHMYCSKEHNNNLLRFQLWSIQGYNLFGRQPTYLIITH